MNQGTLCDIDRMIELKRKHKLRLFIDETVSFGTVGEHGRGITELKGVSMRDIDLIMGSLETSIGSIGGFCVGTTYVVEHQTLAGLGTIPTFGNNKKFFTPRLVLSFPGYCFSASLPPMLAAGALTAVELMEKDPSMFTDLQEKCRAAQEEFSRLPGLKLHGDPMSVVKHLRLERSGGDREADKKALNQVVLKVSGIKNSEVCAFSWQFAQPAQPTHQGEESVAVVAVVVVVVGFGGGAVFGSPMYTQNGCIQRKLLKSLFMS